jgi:hypothetical protein
MVLYVYYCVGKKGVCIRPKSIEIIGYLENKCRLYRGFRAPIRLDIDWMQARSIPDPFQIGRSIQTISIFWIWLWLWLLGVCEHLYTTHLLGDVTNSLNTLHSEYINRIILLITLSMIGVARYHDCFHSLWRQTMPS